MDRAARKGRPGRTGSRLVFCLTERQNARPEPVSLCEPLPGGALHHEAAEGRDRALTSQLLPTVGSLTKGMTNNADGSYDVYFAPEAPEGKEGNWLQTNRDKSWFVLLRMYGPLEPWFNKTWRPGEIELVD